MADPTRWQFRVTDLLLLVAAVAGVVAAFTNRLAVIAFITASTLGAFLWHRPVLSKLWAIGMIGMGAGVLAAGIDGANTLYMPNGDAIGWGTGMAVGGVIYLVVFFRNPLGSHRDSVPPH
jgi:hypothetical protein